ncbi:hypothetical protein [Kurlavirus BKC-1]|nr:hypothetical protein [Kurlavirus BKC-1]
MEPITSEKLSALREQVCMLNERVDFLRLEYDLCEKRQAREKLLRELENAIQELDDLTCELLVTEEAIEQETSLGFWETTPKKTKNFHRELPQEHPEEGSEFGPVQQDWWSGRLIKNAKGDVYRLISIADKYIMVEKQRFLFDPVRWVSVDNRQLTFGRETLWRPLNSSEIVCPEFLYKSAQDIQKAKINPSWVGKTIKNNFTGEKYKFLSCKNGVCMLKTSDGKIRVEPEDSNFWSLVPLEDGEFGKINPDWVGKNVQDKEGRVYEVTSHNLKIFSLCGENSDSWNNRCIHEDSPGWKLVPEQKKDKGKEKAH